MKTDFLLKNKNFKIELLETAKDPVLVSSGENSQQHILSLNQNIYFEAEVFLNSYNNILSILDSTSPKNYIKYEYSFMIAEENHGKNLAPGTFYVYMGERGVSSVCVCAISDTVNLNVWTKIIARRINGLWAIFINGVQQHILKIKDGPSPHHIGSDNLPIYIGRFNVDGEHFDGQIRNLTLKEYDLDFDHKNFSNDIKFYSSNYPSHISVKRLDKDTLKIQYSATGKLFDTSQLKIHIATDGWRRNFIDANSASPICDMIKEDNAWVYYYKVDFGSAYVNFCFKTQYGIWEKNNRPNFHKYQNSNYFYYLRSK